MRKMFCILFLLLSAVPLSIFAEGNGPERGGGPLSYVFHLTYDGRTLAIDKEFPYPYGFLVESYAQHPVISGKAFKGALLDSEDRIAASFFFDPAPDKRGKLPVKAPYAPDAIKADFFDNNGELLASISVADTSLCNDNNVCEKDLGENYENCPNDCTPSLTPGASTIASEIPGAPDKTSGFWNIKTILAIIGMAAIAGSLVAISVKKRV
jgi:hypothetical protein